MLFLVYDYVGAKFDSRHVNTHLFSLRPSERPRSNDLVRVPQSVCSEIRVVIHVPCGSKSAKGTGILCKIFYWRLTMDIEGMLRSF